MAVIGPRFVNGIDVGALRDAGVNWGKQIREDYDQSRKDMNAGLVALGKGIGKARQWEEAKKIKEQLMEKLNNLKALRNEANDELVGLNAMRDEAKGTVVGIDNMLLDANGYPSGIISKGSSGYPDSFALDGEPQDYKALEEMEKFYKYGRRAGL